LSREIANVRLEEIAQKILKRQLSNISNFRKSCSKPKCNVFVQKNRKLQKMILEVKKKLDALKTNPKGPV